MKSFCSRDLIANVGAEFLSFPNANHSETVFTTLAALSGRSEWQNADPSADNGFPPGR